MPMNLHIMSSFAGVPARACIREIYRLWIEEGRSTPWIADQLNKQRIPRCGTPWNAQSVLKILTHEKYAGSLVWGQSSRKLHTRCVLLPKTTWTVVPNVFK